VRVKIDIDDALMNEAFACSKAKTKKEVSSPKMLV
jgi:Arc/MetJ family transcription regulator